MDQIAELKRIGNQARQDLVEMIYSSQAGHTGGSLSVIDLLTVLYYAVMDIDPQYPDWENRDRLVLSKGHAAPALYVTLMRRGFFSTKYINTLRKFNGILQGHPDMNKTPGVDYTSGSLGNGLGVGNGIALAARLRKATYHTYVILGDGELQEGTVWESALSTNALGLSNLTVIVDNNGLQVEDRTNNIKSLGNLKAKWQSFGFDVVEINGHDYNALFTTLMDTKKPHEHPIAIIANTIKGKGISFIENQINWHKGNFTEQTYMSAIKELNEEAQCI